MTDTAAAPALQNPSRRRLLKIGLAGAAVLALGLTLARPKSQAIAAGYSRLRAGDLELFRALIPALIGSNFPADAAARAPLMAELLLRIDGAVNLLQPALRQATLDLLDFVQLAPVHGLSGGYWGSWEEASVEDATAVMHSWSTSSVDLLRASYNALRGLVIGNWYGMPQSWAATGYPGPPAFLSTGSAA